LYTSYLNVRQMTLTKNQRYQPEVNVESTLACYLGRPLLKYGRLKTDNGRMNSAIQSVLTT